MRIWFNQIGEPLPVETNARRLRYGNLTKALAKRGHEVSWWTSGFSHSIKTHVREQDSHEYVGGVHLRMLKGLGYRRNVSLARFRHHRDFARRFFSLAKKEMRPDVIVCALPIIEACKASVELGDYFGTPVVIDVRDEWPDEIVDLAPAPLRPLAKLALSPYFRDTRYFCSKAKGIISVSQSFLQYALRFAGREATDLDGVFPIGYSLQSTPENSLSTSFEWWNARGVRSDSFIVCFFGRIGRFFDLDTVLEAATALEKQYGDIQFVLCGSGSRLENYQKKARGLKSIIMPGWVDAPKIKALMKLSDVGLAPYKSDARMTLPNKPFEYFSGGLAVVSSIQGELRDILNESNSGFTYKSDSTDELVAIISHLYQNRETCNEMGKRGLKLLRKRYTTEVIAQRLEKHLSRIVSS